MARQTNNELSKLPGFFYYPQDKTGLEELTFDQRAELRTNQGNYMVALWKSEANMKTDLVCDFDNSRIPTHRRPGTVIPGNGDVPFDLREVIGI